MPIALRSRLAANPGTVTVQGTAIYGTNTSGMATGGKVLVFGAGTAGADLIGTITNVSGQNITLDVSSGTAVTNVKVIVFNRTLNVSVRKVYNNQQMPAVKPISGGANYNTSLAATEGEVTINAGSELSTVRL